MSETKKTADSEHNPVGLISSSSSDDSCKTTMNEVMTTIREAQYENLDCPKLEPDQKLPIQEVSYPAVCFSCF